MEMSEATKTQKELASRVVTVKVTPLEHLAIQHAAQESNTTMSRIIRAQIVKGLNVAKK